MVRYPFHFFVWNDLENITIRQEGDKDVDRMSILGNVFGDNTDAQAAKDFYAAVENRQLLLVKSNSSRLKSESCSSNRSRHSV